LIVVVVVEMKLMGFFNGLSGRLKILNHADVQLYAAYVQNQ
jgi:hypothetical protein